MMSVSLGIQKIGIESIKSEIISRANDKNLNKGDDAHSLKRTLKPEQKKTVDLDEFSTFKQIGRLHVEHD